MKLKHLKYFSVYSIPAIIVLALYLGGWWTFMPVIVIFGILPLFELYYNGTTKNMDAIEESIATEDRWYDFMLYGLVPVQYAILGFLLYRLGDPSLMLFERIGMTITYGMGCALAINNAHELGHRNTWHEHFMSKLLLLSSLYMHFFIEHNRGHHKNVATEEDPASSRYGEVIYAFYLRTVTGGWMSAWKLEHTRLKRLGKSAFSFENEMLQFQLIQLGFLAAIGFVLGWKVLLGFMGGAIIGFMLLETVNYIEHYGLSRKKNGNRYERTLPVHSWNSNHPLGRLLLLELTRHSDHHFMANRKYQVLRHFDEAPQFPTGYPGMMMLALIPPLWFHVMHKRIAEYKQSAQGAALA